MDSKDKQGYQDDAKIAKDELPYWCKKWGVSKGCIQDAIEATGSHGVKTIEQYLRDTGQLD